MWMSVRMVLYNTSRVSMVLLIPGVPRTGCRSTLTLTRMKHLLKMNKRMIWSLWSFSYVNLMLQNVRQFQLQLIFDLPLNHCLNLLASLYTSVIGINTVFITLLCLSRNSSKTSSSSHVLMFIPCFLGPRISYLTRSVCYVIFLKFSMD